MSALIVNKKEKRDIILHAAIKVFAEKGLTNTTIKDISVEAGIGKGTVYEYFKDKEEIIHNSFFFFQKIFEFDIEKILLLKENGLSKLRRLIKVFLKVVQGEDSGYLELIFDFWAQGIKGHSKGLMLQEMNKFYKTYRKVFVDIIDEGIEDGSIRNDADPGPLSSIIVGMLDGIMVQWIFDRQSVSIPAIEKNLLDLAVKGIMNKEIKKEET